MPAPKKPAAPPKRPTAKDMKAGPEKLAPAYVLLASQDGSFMTGALVHVTGGKLSSDD